LTNNGFYPTQTNDGKWQERLDGILDNIMKHFFKDGVAWEEICEEDRECNVDQIVYRNTMFRSLGAISLLAPATADKMAPIMEKSAEAAVEQCTGGSSGRQCGFFWVDGEFEKPQTSGLGEQMNALSAVTNLLLKDAEKPQKEEKDNKGDNKEENKGEKGDGDESTKTEGGESEETPAPDSAAGRAAVGSVSVAVATVGMLLAALMA
jgi:mannan endo-1,6-alpha-mannosidase